MAYNPLSAVQAIANYKNIYANAVDDNERNDAATKAKQYYDELMANGQGDIANKLKNSDYAGAAKIQDGLGTNGMVQTRDYVKNKLKAYGGINDSDFGYNPENQNVTLKGVNLGKAGYESSEGRTYYNQGDLDKQIQNVIQTNNMGRTDKVAYDTTKEDLIARQKTKMDEINGDPTQSAIYKSIMESVAPKSVAAGENAVASGSADNGGNIDSFAAANGLRQKTAVQNMGRETALNSWLAQQNLARGLLQDYSGTTQNLFNNDQTGNINAAKINESIAGITGTVPNDVSIKSNPFFNPDGTLINPDTDFQAIINKAPNEATKQYAMQARAKKLLLPQYSQFGTPQFTAPAKTATMTLSEQQIAAQKEEGAANRTSAETIAAAKLYAPKDNKPTITAAVAKESYDNGVRTPAVIEAYNYYYGTNISPDDTAPLGEDGKVLSNEERVKNIIFKTPSDGSSKTYYPIQELLANRSNYESSTSKEYIDKLIVEEAKKIAKAEGRKVGSWEIDDILKANGFTDHTELKKLFD